MQITRSWFIFSYWLWPSSSGTLSRPLRAASNGTQQRVLGRAIGGSASATADPQVLWIHNHSSRLEGVCRGVGHVWNWEDLDERLSPRYGVPVLAHVRVESSPLLLQVRAKSGKHCCLRRITKFANFTKRWRVKTPKWTRGGEKFADRRTILRRKRSRRRLRLACRASKRGKCMRRRGPHSSRRKKHCSLHLHIRKLSA